METTRRTVVRILSMGAVAAMLPAKRTFAVATEHATTPEHAAAPHKLDIHDPAAAALGYTEHADTVDAKKYPAYTNGSTCENCLQLGGAAGSNYRPCNLFPGKLVAVGGWCSGWTAEM